MLAGMIARPRATSSRTKSGGVMNSGMAAPKALAVGETLGSRFDRLLAREILAMGDIDHLFGNDPGAGEFELGDELARLSRAQPARRGAERRKTIFRNVAIVLGLDRARLRYGEVAGFDPGLAHRLEAAGKIDRYVAFGIGSGRIIDPDRRLVRVAERNLSEGNANIGAAAGERHRLSANPQSAPVVTVRGAANLGISFMAVSSRIKSDGRNHGRTNGRGYGRCTITFAGMTRIRFKGFLACRRLQPRSGRPSSKIECGPSGSVCQLSLRSEDFLWSDSRGRTAVSQGPKLSRAAPTPPEGIAGRPLARLRAAKRAAR